VFRDLLDQLESKVTEVQPARLDKLAFQVQLLSMCLCYRCCCRPYRYYYYIIIRPHRRTN